MGSGVAIFYKLLNWSVNSSVVRKKAIGFSRNYFWNAPLVSSSHQENFVVNWLLDLQEYFLVV